MGMRQLKISKSITNRTSDGLDKYLQEISKIPLVTAEEEVELAIKIKTGDETALHRLVNGNLRFVVSVAKQYQHQGLNLADLIDEGNLGLIKAAMRFDETKGFKFISFAVWWIRQTILLSLAEQGRIIRMPLNKVGLNNRIVFARQLFEQQNEREPTAEELSEILELDLIDIIDTISNTQRHISMDSPVHEGEESTLVDTISDPNADATDINMEYKESLHQEVQIALSALTKKQRQIICYFFGIGMENCLSLEDIALMLNLTRERVRQIKEKAITRLKLTDCSNHLKGFLG